MGANPINKIDPFGLKLQWKCWLCHLAKLAYELGKILWMPSGVDTTYADYLAEEKYSDCLKKCKDDCDDSNNDNNVDQFYPIVPYKEWPAPVPWGGTGHVMPPWGMTISNGFMPFVAQL